MGHPIEDKLKSNTQRTNLPPSFSFNQSNLQDYVDCQRRFHLRYVEQLDWPAVEIEPVMEYERHQQEGLLFHRLVQQHLLGLPDEKIARLANTPNLNRWWESFLQHGPFNSNCSQYIELTLSAPICVHRLTAKYDLVITRPDAQGDRVIIYDWKTYHKRPQAERLAARVQTQIYRSLLVKAGTYLTGGNPVNPDQVEMIYWFTNFPDEPLCFPYNTNQYELDWDVLKKLVTEIMSAQDFPPTSNDRNCRFCLYRSYCNRGIVAGTWDNTDDVLESVETGFDINFEQIAELEF